MSLVITNQSELNRANIQAAWQFAWKMKPEDFDRLCQATSEQMRRDAGCTDEALAVA